MAKGHAELGGETALGECESVFQMETMCGVKEDAPGEEGGGPSDHCASMPLHTNPSPVKRNGHPPGGGDAGWPAYCVLPPTPRVSRHQVHIKSC